MYPRPRNPFAAPKRKKQSRVGKVTGTVRLYGVDKSKLREEVYLRARGFCELRLEGCGGYATWKSGHLAHVVSLGAGGPDSESNCKWSCSACHIRSHVYGVDGVKPVPTKAKKRL
jgi:5-methylcytosine-specific restriction endonuclease McrA